MAKYPYYIEGNNKGIRDQYFYKILSVNSYLEINNTTNRCSISREIITNPKSNTDDMFRHKREDGVWEIDKSGYMEITEEYFENASERVSKILNFKLQNSKKSQGKTIAIKKIHEENQIVKTVERVEKMLQVATEEFSSLKEKIQKQITIKI